jgi:DNA-directed RNA polymerases I, II, and III subunit RPABC2
MDYEENEETVFEPESSGSEVIAEEERSETRIKKSERKTLPRMTKYEKAHVLGVRASQLSAGASPLIDIGNEFDPLTIAAIELNEKKIPFIVRRWLPDNSFEDWGIDELLIPGIDF